VFEAERDLAHGFGRADGDGWSAATGPDARGTLLCGPYTREIPAGAATATFRLMVDNRSADNGVVVRLEVNDFDGAGPDCGDCVVASRELRRMELSSPMSYQDFSVRFSAVAGHRLEFRVYWTDISYVRVDRVVVTSP
jgi:bacterioferritin-associated ferredoxin